MKRFVYFALSVWFVLSACRLMALLTPTVAPTAVGKPTDTLRPTNIASPTATPLPSPTVTPPPSPTVALPPSPTAAPPGFYDNSDAGFAFQAPAGWEIVEESSSWVEMKDNRSGVFLLAMSYLGDKTMTTDELVDSLEEGFFADMTVTVLAQNEITLSGGVTALQVELKAEGDYTLESRVVYAHLGSRDYFVILYGLAGILKDEAQTLDDVVASLQVYRPQIYGLDPSETLYLSEGYEPTPEDLDPALTTTSAADYVGYLFSGLVRLDPQMQIVPDLAESWTVSADGLVYTFKLRPNLKFSNGDPITAQDVKDSWERTTDPALKSTTARTYLGDIVGVEEKLDRKASEISGVEVIDDLTLKVTLDGPKPYFLAKIAYPTAYVYDVEQASRDAEWMFAPHASGPYFLKEHIEGEAFIFERNDYYPTPPAIKYVVQLQPQGVSELSLYKDGVIDIVYLGSEDAIQARKPDNPLHAEWQSIPSLCTFMVQMNNTQPPFDDVNVRLAFAQAIDREKFVEILSKNKNLSAVSILPPAMPGFSPDNVVAGFDAAAAKAALGQSRYAGNLPTVTLAAGGYGDADRRDVNVLTQMWQDNLGVKVKVVYVDPSNVTEAERRQKAHMSLYGWCADYPDPENFLDVLYHSDSDFNVGNYTNPQVDALLEQARTTTDAAERLALYQQVEALLLSDGAVIPLVHAVYDVLVKPRVQGFVISPMHISFILWVSLSDAEQP